MILKDQLHALMKLQGLSAAELARRSGVSKQVLSLWLGGSEPRHIGQVQQVAQTLGVSIEELCFGKPQSADTRSSIEGLIGGEWFSGLFEVKLRRVRNDKK